MKLVSLFLFCFLTFCFSACIDPYDPKLVGTERYLAFEGVLTDAPGPYRFTLSKSAGYNSDESVFDSRLTGATVSVTDNTGQTTRFLDDGRGSYLSPTGFRGLAGRRYTLNVTYAGQSFRSDAELLQAVPPIDTVYRAYKPQTSGLAATNGDFAVYLDLKDPAGTPNYYQWDWVHYEKPAYCVLYRPPGSNITYAKRCCPLDCWTVSRSVGEITIASDQFINGNRLTGQLVARVPFDDSTPYYLRIGQQSLSEGAYQYWQTVRTLTSNVGGVFDATPATLPGNLHNIKTDGDAALRPTLLGYFQVSARRERLVYINRFAPPKLPFAKNQYPISPTCEPCTETLYRTAIQPEGWQN